MSKRAKKQVRKTHSGFTYTPTSKLPKLGKIRTKWDLKALYYKSDKDPRIEKDISATERAYAQFERKWRNKNFTKSADTLKKALTDYEQLAGTPAATRPIRYFAFRSVLDANDMVAEKRLSLISERLRKASDRVLFFTLVLGKISKKEQKQFLNDPKLHHFAYYLQRVFENAKHNLSEAEEKIINLKSRQSHGRWIDMVEKLISNRTISWKGADVAMPEAIEMLDALNAADKQKLWDLMMDAMEDIGQVAEHELNAVITDTRTEDELRKFPKPYSATALAYEDTEQSIENLVHAVSTKGFELSKKFYRLKATYHGEKKLHYTRKYDSIGTAPEIPFEQSVEICRDVFYGLKTEYGTIFDTMLTRGQIDVYPKKGKRGGAFMSAETGHPVHVFLNYTSTFKALETLAHEMGHAIHAHRGSTQSPFYDGHSIATAETASTLFENLLVDAVLRVAPESQKPVLLHDRITRDIATIQRQIAFFNCELEMHQTIASQGAMTNEEFASCMYRHLKSYLGSAISLEKRDGYCYAYVPHLRMGFYVYTYAFGILMSTIMANRYKADNRYIEKIDQFLTAGQSDTVANIFKSIDINTNRKDTFTEALKNHERDIKAFEEFTKKRTK